MLKKQCRKEVIFPSGTAAYALLYSSVWALVTCFTHFQLCSRMVTGIIL